MHLRYARCVHIVAAAVSCRAQALWQGGTDRAPELLVLAGEPVGAFAYGLSPGAAEPSPGALFLKFVRSPLEAWPQSGLRGCG